MVLCNYVTSPEVGDLFLRDHRQRCNNTGLQLKKSKRITVRHFYSLVPMSQSHFTRVEPRGTQGFSLEKFTKVQKVEYGNQ